MTQRMAPVQYVDIPGLGRVEWRDLLPTGDEGDDPALLRMHLDDAKNEIARLRAEADR